MSCAIAIEGVCKKFKRVTLKSNYGTFKSIVMSKFGGTGGRVASSPDEDAFIALSDINLQIPKGETWGIIGRNGSGKSTLLKLIAGIYKPDKGEISIDGRVSALIELGAGFHPDFSGRENVFINASILGFSRKNIEESFDEIVAFAELEDFIDNPVRTYSSGMFMRLGFSIAVHVDPSILLVDEVLAVGDEAFAHKCHEKMESFKKEGKTIILVSHSLGDIDKWCDNAVWIEAGKVMATGKTTRVIDKYLAEVNETENEKALERSDIKEDSKRWGDHKVEITGVSLCDETEAKRKVFITGQGMVAEISYSAKSEIKEPVFGIAIHKRDGGECYASNTDIEGMEIEKIEGEGKISLNFDNLLLVEGSYFLSVAVHAKDGHAYDFHDQMYEFSMRSKIKDGGVFRPSHSWTLNGNKLEPEGS